ncbi:TraB/GumN family protein [Pseudotenacibaculum sp. MALMAid0570]|uniref:TraB/GumN family protein n=1 Tax=Pseudotenacibaculum sp. MALMAid0570 TaxID=3143938 RepID=UPI0032DF30BF
MKKALVLLCFIISAVCFSQTQNSLLWKISGNGLEKDSYLFGTMHVSERIAFHLDDVFFESLLKSDIVALESNPELWLDHSFESGDFLGGYNLNNVSKNFYNSQFKFTPPKIREMSLFLSNEHYLLNGILYRTNPMMQDFQEETYLDMFIFQSGSKFGKEVVGLEDIERSSNLVEQATKGEFRKDSPDLWLQKLMKEKDYFSLMSDSYRERNISFLDSLNTAIYNKKYLENMLYIRNEDMVKSIDSLVKHGSVFSAVGAAHLAGEKGMIQKLKDRGYTVTPLTSEITGKGKEIKEKIEKKEAEIIYKPRESSDGFFSVNSPSKLYEIGAKEFTIYLSPNIRNGAYYTIARVNIMSEFGGEIKSLDDIDKILFENIPGKIISKKEISKNGYKGLDIINQTKIGDYQRYQIFITPLETIVFKMAGKREYVLKNGNLFFNSIKFLNVTSEFVKVQPKHKGFEISVPRFHTFNNSDQKGNRFLQSIDNQGNYYFLKEVVLNDMSYIEEDDFELERIHNRFYKNAKLTFDTGMFVGEGKSRAYVSKSQKTKEGKYTHLKTVINGRYYYLIGKISKDSTQPEKYFDSFKLAGFQYDNSKLEKRKDTSLHFTVNTWVKPSYGYTRNSKDRKDYESYIKTSTFSTRDNEMIEVKLNKLHDWEYYENIDSLWNDQINKFARKNLSRYNIDRIIIDDITSYLNKRKFKVTEKEKGKDSFGNETISYLLRDTLSSRAVKVKKVYSEGRIYTLKTLIDVRHDESKFVQEFFKTFQPEKPKREPVDLFKSKVAIFVKALKDGDSIAINSYSRIKFKEEHIDLLIDLLKDNSLNSNQQLIKGYLIGELTKFKSKRVERFIDYLYKSSFNNPYSQIAIFKSLAKDKKEESFKKLMSLLKVDIPITSKEIEIRNMFKSLKDTLSLTKDLFPELLTYTTVDDYKEPVYYLLAGLLEKELISPKNYKKYKDQILTEARIELKKQLSSTIDKKKNNLKGIPNYSNSYNNNSNSDLLELYVKLLAPYAKDNVVDNLLAKIPLIDNIDVKATYVTELIKTKQKVSNKILNELLEDMEGRYALFTRLKKANRLDALPSQYLTKEKIYESRILKNVKMKEKDSVIFVGRRDVKIKEKDYEVFFYKVKASKYRYSKPKWELHYAAFKKEGDKIQSKTVYSRNNQYIDKTEPLEEQLKIHLEKIRLKDRKRVEVSVSRQGLYGYY